MKLGIGTAQFGMAYGIANLAGKTSQTDASAIVRFAGNNDIDVIDTAQGYGDSEEVLGKVLPHKNKFRIITKTPKFTARPLGPQDATELKNIFHRSLLNLRQHSIEGLLVHSADDLLAPGGDSLFTTLQDLKQTGMVRKIGVSVYTGEQLDNLLERYPVDIIQLPINVMDTRLIESGHLSVLKRRGIEVHARSIFLQGLLLIDPGSIHSFFKPIIPLLNQYHAFLRDNELTPVQGAFCFMTGIAEIDYLIIGVNQLHQLKVNFEAFHKDYERDLHDQIRKFALNNPLYVNPANWKIHEA